jgi:hypothetical protein
MALWAVWPSGISTKPKPRERPVSRSVIIPHGCYGAIELEALTQVLLCRGTRQGADKDVHAWFSRGSEHTGAAVSHHLLTADGCATAHR